jgi:hypothetical protein
MGITIGVVGPKTVLCYGRFAAKISLLRSESLRSLVIRPDDVPGKMSRVNWEIEMTMAVSFCSLFVSIRTRHEDKTDGDTITSGLH